MEQAYIILIHIVVIKMDDIPVIQLRGSDVRNILGLDIREAFDLEDIKHKITKYYFLNFTKDYNYSLEDSLRVLKEKYVNKEIQQEEYERQREVLLSGQVYKFWIDGAEIDISETGDYQLIKPEHIPEVKLGSGVCLDISIQRREIEYDVEENVSEVIRYKKAYLEACNILTNYIKLNKVDTKTEFNVPNYNYDDTNQNLINNDTYTKQLKIYQEEKKRKYNNFLETLVECLEEKEVLAW